MLLIVVGSIVVSARLAVTGFDVLAAILAMNRIFGAFVLPWQCVLTLLAGDLTPANLEALFAVVANSIR